MIPLEILSKIGGFLQDNWKFFLALFVVIGCYMYISGLQDQITSLNNQHTTDVAAYTLLDETSKANEDKFKKQIQDQNDAIDNQHKQLDEANARIAKLIADYTKRDKEHQRKIAELLKVPVPTTCPGAVDYLIEQSGGLQWSK